MVKRKIGKDEGVAAMLDCPGTLFTRSEHEGNVYWVRDYGKPNG
jgi:hypothetical protein